MKSVLVFVVAALVFTACETQPPKTRAGMANWGEVMAAADAIILKSDTATFIRHGDFSGITKEAADQMKTMPTTIQPMINGMKHTATETMTLAEHTAFESVEAEKRGMTARPYSWNIQPEKILLYKFEKPTSGTAERSNTKATVYLGVFQQNGRWFFAASYRPKRDE
jgi:hypothetical protein